MHGHPPETERAHVGQVDITSSQVSDLTESPPARGP